MNRQAWARLLATTLLSIGVAACSSSSTKKNPGDLGTGDLGVADMPAGTDLTASPDQSGPQLFFGQITAADVVGTVYLPGATASAAPTPVFSTHALATLVSFPSAAAPANAFSGCTISRYDLTSSNPANLPVPNVDSGPVTISGYTYDDGFDTSVTSPAPSPSPAYNSVACDYSSGAYGCVFETSGALTTNVVFPPLTGPSGPILQPLFPAGATIIEDFAANNTTPYKGQDFQVQLLASTTPFNILSINGVSPSPVPGSYTDLDTGLAGQFDGQHDITITWNCGGANCPAPVTAVPLDIAGLLIQTGPSQTNFGVAQCVFPSSAQTLTLHAADIAKLLGGASDQTVRVLFVHIQASSPSISSDATHYVIPTVGRGEFAFVQQTTP